MQSSFWSRRPGRIATLATALLAAGGLSGTLLVRNSWADQRTQQGQRAHISQPEVNARTAPLADLESGFIAINERLQPSVVSIRVNKTVRTAGMGGFGGGGMQDPSELFRQFGLGGQDGDMPAPRMRMQQPRQYTVRGAGSGVIVRSDGWILTNDHVVGDADKVTVKLSDGREFPGTVRRDFRSDLALVKINASNLTAAELGDSDRVRVGQWAIAFGSPFELDNTMTVGIISARSRSQEVGSRGEARAYSNLLQTDAAINPGNSGGALVNIRGEVIGINVAIESPSGGSVGIGFAIPSNTAKMVMDQLISSGHVTRSYLGVVPRPLTFDEKQKFGATNGAIVQSVSDGTPAARAGLQPGDVIVRFNGRQVADDVALRDMVASMRPGSRVDVVVRRDGREQTLPVTVEAMPTDIANGTAGQDNQPPAQHAEAGKLGVQVEAVTADTAKKYNLGNRVAGVVIMEVQSGSPAEEAGLQPGMVILRANGHAVNAPQELKSAVDAVKSGDSLDLVIFANKARTLVSVKMP